MRYLLLCSWVRTVTEFILVHLALTQSFRQVPCARLGDPSGVGIDAGQLLLR